MLSNFWMHKVQLEEVLKKTLGKPRRGVRNASILGDRKRDGNV